MQEINAILEVIDGYIGGAQWFVLLLLGTGLFFTLYLGFPQFRFTRHAFRVVRGMFDKKDAEGDTSHFQALATALSGTVGTGNIAGVALAVHLGGPAALFWMLVTAFFGMTLKFVEVTLSLKYRGKASDGTASGGPMYYMKHKLNMKWLAIVFAIATIISSFGTGNLPQINSISNSMFATFGVNHILTGAILAVILGIVIIGGIRRIAKVTEKLVPGMAIIYIIGAFGIIFYNYENIIPSLVAVFADVFTGTAAVGGFMGAGFAFAFNRGVNRGLFSNEAGQGSAAIAHSSVRTDQPVSEGLVALLGPFIDTIIICTITGLVLLSSGAWKDKIHNQFQYTDIQVLASTYDEDNPEDVEKLSKHLNKNKSIDLFSGSLKVEDGKIQNDLSVMHARSLAENIQVNVNEKPYTGEIPITDGKIDSEFKHFEDLVMQGKSLIHSAPLTATAFERGIWGKWGQYIISIGLLLFAFSTAISWSYYGDRAVVFLLGSNYVVYYRILYVVGFFLASFTDTTLVWTFSGIAIAFMTLPNLVGILLLRKDMKQSVYDYWAAFQKEHPNWKVPEKWKKG